MEIQKKKAIKNVLTACKLIRKEFGDLPYPQLICLLEVMVEEGITKNQIGANNDPTMPVSSINRYVARLTDEHERRNAAGKRVPGPLTVDRDPDLPQRHLVSLTSFGKLFREALVNEMEA